MKRLESTIGDLPKVLAVQYYMFLRHGFEGYRRIMQHTLDNAIALRKTLVDSGYFTIMNETQRIPVVAVTLDKKITKFNEFDVSNKVREKGWVLSAYTMPPTPKRCGAYGSWSARTSITMWPSCWGMTSSLHANT